MSATDPSSYATVYDFAEIQREDGILDVRFHTEGGPWHALEGLAVLSTPDVT